jgi:hypothetical protein
MDHQDKMARWKQMLQQVAPEGSLETLMPPAEESLELTSQAGGTRFSEAEIAKASALTKPDPFSLTETDPGDAQELVIGTMSAEIEQAWPIHTPRASRAPSPAMHGRCCQTGL